MKILVTGTDGAIGGALKTHLCSRGFQVFGTVFFRSPGENECRLDLANGFGWASLPRSRFDAVVHTAGIIDQSLPRRLIHEVNANGTRRIAAWAAGNGCPHFIFTGSIAAYGVFAMGEHRTERTPVLRALAPLPYMESKISAEKTIRKSRLRHTILRLPTVIGKNDSYLSPTVIPALADDRFFFSGRGDRLVSLMSITNFCHFVEELLGHGPLDAAYNAADWHVPWNKLVGCYAKILGMKMPEKRKSILTLFPRFHDKHELLLLTFSCFGSHFPDAALHRILPHDHPQPWEEAVEEAVRAYHEKKADDGSRHQPGRPQSL